MKIKIEMNGVMPELVLDVSEIMYLRNDDQEESKTLGWIGIQQEGCEEMVYIEIEKLESLEEVKKRVV